MPDPDPASTGRPGRDPVGPPDGGLAVARVTLAGHHVVLEPLALTHVTDLAAAAAESREHFGYDPVPDGVEEARADVTVALADQASGDRMPFAIRFHGRVVGTTNFWELRPWTWPAGSRMQRTDRPDAVEIGATWLAASVVGTSCNVASKLLLLTHAFETWEVHRVSLRTDARNARSRRAIETLGAQLEGVRRAHRPGLDGTVRDSAYYSIVAYDWPVVRERLAERLRRRTRLDDRRS